jgi:hypothetical protein
VPITTRKHSRDGHHSIIVPVTTRKHSSDENDDIITSIATRAYHVIMTIAVQKNAYYGYIDKI